MRGDRAGEISCGECGATISAPSAANNSTNLRTSEEADSDLVRRLKAIRDNDWRFSMLAYTSDTAGEAAEALSRLSLEVGRLKRENDRLRYIAERGLYLFEHETFAMETGTQQNLWVRDARNALAGGAE